MTTSQASSTRPREGGDTTVHDRSANLGPPRDDISAGAGPVYGPEELEALSVAFSRTIETVALPAGAERQPGAVHYAKETVAKLIIGLAKSGERDLDTIVAQTVDRLTI